MSASTKQEFQSMLNDMDWTYEYADDHRIWLTYHEYNRVLLEYIRENDTDGSLQLMYQEARYGKI